MKERLEVLSGGTVTIDIYPSAVLGNEPQCIEQLQNGSLAMMKTSAASIEDGLCLSGATAFRLLHLTLHR